MNEHPALTKQDIANFENKNFLFAIKIPGYIKRFEYLLKDSMHMEYIGYEENESLKHKFVICYKTSKLYSLDIVYSFSTLTVKLQPIALTKTNRYKETILENFDITSFYSYQQILTLVSESLGTIYKD